MQAVSFGEALPHTPCSDSVTSVHDHFSEASPPDNLAYAQPIATRPHSTIGFYTGLDAQYSASAPGSSVSLGSPPARELSASEPAAGPLSPKGTTAREQLASVLPPRGNQLRPSETLLRHLGRTDSANHAQEMEALHQVRYLVDHYHHRVDCWGPSQLSLPALIQSSSASPRTSESLFSSSDFISLGMAFSGSFSIQDWNVHFEGPCRPQTGKSILVATPARFSSSRSPSVVCCSSLSAQSPL